MLNAAVRKVVPLVIPLLLALTLSTTAVRGANTPRRPATHAAPARTAGILTVFADASLTQAFASMASAFEQTYPAVHVELTFGSSPTLARELEHGVAADVFATMDGPTLKRLMVGHAVAGAPYVFARNQLQIVVAAQNPKRIDTLADLGNRSLTVATCRQNLPCGRDTARTFARAGLVPVGSGQEQDSPAIIARVASGQADAGLVYVTDLDAASGRVEAIDIPDTVNVTASYRLALMLDTDNDRAAVAFFTFVLSPRGQAILERFGFMRP